MENEHVRCKVCGCKQMRPEVLRSSSDWRYRYKCPVCGAVTPRARTAARALQVAQAYNRSKHRIWQPIACPFYKRHNRQGKWLQCESPLSDGLVLTNSFHSGIDMDLYMQMCCRCDANSEPVRECPIAKLCEEKF